MAIESSCTLQLASERKDKFGTVKDLLALLYVDGCRSNFSPEEPVSNTTKQSSRWISPNPFDTAEVICHLEFAVSS